MKNEDQRDAPTCKGTLRGPAKSQMQGRRPPQISEEALPSQHTDFEFPVSRTVR